jgi:hypothetical protein
MLTNNDWLRRQSLCREVSPLHERFHVAMIQNSLLVPASPSTKIVNRLPGDGELQYRIKNAAEEHERIALESELRAF